VQPVAHPELYVPQKAYLHGGRGGVEKIWQSLE
jgi:hypothetical protein